MSSVSRETQPDEDLVRTLFPSRVSEINRYVHLLGTIGTERGLIGPREAPRLWERHILNCAVVSPAFAPGASVADIGSGAGLPGVVLALCRPDLRMTLVEPLHRRVAFLHEVLEELGLTSVAVIPARAEDLHNTMLFDAVTARAVAPLGRLVPWALPLCRPGGELVAIKGAGAADELAGAEQLLKAFSVSETAIERYGEGVVSPLTTVLRIRSRD